jgi:acetolactate synthase small subunit
MTLLVEQDNDIELALSSMACQIPVISVVDNKASRLLGVFPSLATTPNINEVIDYVSSFKGHEFDVSEFTVENFAKKLKKLL